MSLHDFTTVGTALCAAEFEPNRWLRNIFQCNYDIFWLVSLQQRQKTQHEEQWWLGREPWQFGKCQVQEGRVLARGDTACFEGQLVFSLSNSSNNSAKPSSAGLA